MTVQILNLINETALVYYDFFNEYFILFFVENEIKVVIRIALILFSK